ncbi:MAG: hypothetical protein CL928_01215 [Deltaproteobacteria bacterium]|nr:hypothetical protein [Deltaproteobacteria bacterium]
MQRSHTRLVVISAVALLTSVVLLPSLHAAQPADAPDQDVQREHTLELLRQLQSGQQLPAARAIAVDALSDEDIPIRPQDLLPLFSPGVHTAAAIDGARIAAQRRDPALAPLMFQAFLNSKFNRIPHDPDVFEELLRGLQKLDQSARRNELEGLELPDLAAMVASRLDLNWLGPLTGDTAGVAALFDDQVLEAVTIQSEAWLQQLLQSDGQGWVQLQTDSGDRAFRFLSQLELMFLTVVIAEGTPEHSQAALEAARQRTAVREDVLDAIALLASGNYPVDIGKSETLQSALGELWPRPPGDPSREGTSRRLYPVGPLEVEPFSASPLVTGAATTAPNLSTLIAAGALALVIVWLAALRLRPSWRSFLFPLGAVGLVALGLVGIEALLALSGMQPLGMTRSTFNPASAPVSLYARSERDGRPVLETAAGSLRHTVFEQEKPPETLRVFALGASSVHGSNYLAREAWPQVLGRRLEAQLGGTHVEVINAGAGGAVSDQIQLHVQEFLDYQPDLLVLSLGYNDFEHVPALARYRAFSPHTLALRFVLDRSRLVRLLTALVPAIAPDTEGDGAYHDSSPPDEGDWPLIQRLTQLSFEQNLERAWFHSQRAGVPLLFLLQGQNEDLCGERSAEGAAAEGAHCFPEAMRAAVLRVAGRTGMPVVDTAEALRRHSPVDVVGSDYYWDIIHPSRLGHRVIGEASAPAALGLLQASDR